jgi:hypothetical protein
MHAVIKPRMFTVITYRVESYPGGWGWIQGPYTEVWQCGVEYVGDSRHLGSGVQVQHQWRLFMRQREVHLLEQHAHFVQRAVR